MHTHTSTHSLTASALHSALLTTIIVVGCSFFTSLLTACSGIEGTSIEDIQTTQQSVLVVCEGNYNSGNASLSIYNPTTHSVDNGVFQRVNGRKLGDTGQSATVSGNRAYVAVENSGIVWCVDTRTMKVQGQLTTGETDHMINPRYVHIVSPTKAYITDLYAPYITIFNPTDMTYTGSIATGQPTLMGYASTERMVQSGKYVYTNCWCYSRNILVIDTQRDEVVDSIVLTSYQPKSMKIDRQGKLWVVTDGGYGSEDGTSPDASFADNVPHLYRIDTSSRTIELDITLDTDEASVDLAMNPKGDVLYLLNNDVYHMSIYDQHPTSTPLIEAPRNLMGKRHKLYGIDVNPRSGDIYVADAIDYAQAGVVYRYTSDGTLIDKFRVGINPNGFAFLDGNTSIQSTDTITTDTHDSIDHTLVSKIFEYMPAPGHQVNGYSVVGDFIHDGATMDEACDSVMSHFRHGWMVSLGAQGGYLVAGFDHDVKSGNDDYDLIVRGNPYSYQSEPGIVWVMRDDNCDGLPNDTWYELAGSEYGTDNETLHYAITYYKPSGKGQDIRWTDNQGGEGIVPYMKAWNTHPSYWQDWVPTTTTPEGECRTYYGSRLKDTHTYNASTGMSLEPAFAWGYADNAGKDCKSSKTYLKLSNAVDDNGTPVHLDHINFVKIQTAQTGYTPNLGEISTEVYGIWCKQ